MYFKTIVISRNNNLNDIDIHFSQNYEWILPPTEIGRCFALTTTHF